MNAHSPRLPLKNFRSTKRVSFLLVAAFCSFAVLSTVVSGVATTEVVSSANMHGWVITTSSTATAGFVIGPDTPPLQVGSGELLVGSDGAGAAQFRQSAYNGTLLSNLTALSYSSYTSNDGTVPAVGDQTVYIILNIDQEGDGDNDFLLFFEPEYQHGYTTNVPDQGDNVLNTWQTWDALVGGWWSPTGAAGASPGAGVKPLSDIIAAFPNARIHNNLTTGSVRLVAGFGPGAWDNFVGNVDAVTIGVSGTDVIYDFEPLPTISIDDVEQNEGDSGTTDYTFTVTLSRASDETVTVDYGTADDSATDASDYNAISTTTLTFAPGETTQPVTVQVNGDSAVEPDEQFLVELTNPTNATISDDVGVGTITNDDDPVVNTTDDLDDEVCDSTHCSLREAIDAANALSFSTITFNIPTSVQRYYYAEDGGGLTNGTLGAVTPTTSDDDAEISDDIDEDWKHSWWSIAPGSALPEITASVTIDGYSQRPCSTYPEPCSQANTLPTGDDAVLLIEIDGSGADGGGFNAERARSSAKRGAASTKGGPVGTDGLLSTVSTGDFTEIKGLVINRFSGSGIRLSQSVFNIISGNFIGTDVSGTLAANHSFGNGVGIRIENSSVNEVGCTVSEDRNIISGNVGDGVQISGADASVNIVQGNLIGPGRDGSMIGNGGAGVKIYDSSDNIIGSLPEIDFDEGNRLEDTAPGQNVPQVSSDPGNVIAGNGDDGVAVNTGTTAAEAFNNLISQNSIFDNGDLGIDLDNDGVTANDNCDTDPPDDEGPNHLQNYPTVTLVVTDGPTTTIYFTLDSIVGGPYTVEFFSNTNLGPSEDAEGHTYIGSTTVTISGPMCSENFSHQVGALAPGDLVTATATDRFGNTSEFSSVASPSAADATVSGVVSDDSGAPVAGVVVRLSGSQTRTMITDSKGRYYFDQVANGGFYTVTPSRANYSFSPSLRSFNQLGNHTDAAFTGSTGSDTTNPLDTPEYFVRQQYVDILGREPDEGGFNYWSNEINRCGSDTACVNARRRDIAAAFFIEQEFQQSGSYIYNLYSGALGRKPRYAEYASDRRQVVGGANLESEKAAFAARFVQRADFVQKYQASTTADLFVDVLLQTVQQTSGVDLSSQRANLVSDYGSGGNIIESRSLVLRRVADNAAFKQAEYNAAFVLTEYFGYLKRDPEPGGFDFWLNVLNNREPGNFRGMVCSFITSTEYQKRFSSVVTHNNAECGR